MEQILFYKISYLAVVIGGLVIGIFILFKKAKGKFNILYILLNFSMVLWALGRYALLEVGNHESALFWARFLYIGSILVHLFFLHVILVFVGKDQKRKPFLIIFYLNCAFIFILNLIDLFFGSNFFIKDVGQKLIFKYYEIPNNFYNLHLINYLIIPTWAFIEIIVAFRKSVGIKRDQLKYILISGFLGFIGGNSVVPLIYNIPLFPIGVFLVPIHLFTMTYAITRYRLTDIRVIIRESAIYALSFITILAIFFIALWSISYIIDASIQRVIFLNIAFLMIIALSFYRPVINLFTNLANKYFFASLYKKEKVLHDLIEKIPSVIDIRELAELLSKTLTDVMKIEKLGIWYVDFKKKIFEPVFLKGFDKEKSLLLLKDETLQKYTVETKQPLLYKEIAQIKAILPYEEERIKALKQEIKDLGVAIYVPLVVKDQLIGLIAMGDKFGSETYTKEDILMLELLAKQAAVALENARLYDETQQFSETLKKEINKATSDLKKANIELQKLDQAKSDFISIASHQLRTPLTIIKGFVSMILEGLYGPVSEAQKDKLEKIYESNERLSRLVDDLLNLSHIEGGKMKFDLKKTGLSKMVKDVIEELSFQAERKKLELKFKKPAKEIFVLADGEKLRHIVFNLIDNAIKYTEKGEIEVFLEKTPDDFIQFKVQDTGVGIDKKELPNLFKKFSRGANAPRYHTEGVGIGLYVAKRMMEEHKGEIWAESAGDGKGSAFFVKLPEWQEKNA